MAQAKVRATNQTLALHPRLGHASFSVAGLLQTPPLDGSETP
jgi:hypothetical protein